MPVWMVQSLQALAEQTTNRSCGRDQRCLLAGGRGELFGALQHQSLQSLLVHGGRGRKAVCWRNSGAPLPTETRPGSVKSQIGDDVSDRRHRCGHRITIFSGQVVPVLVTFSKASAQIAAPPVPDLFQRVSQKTIIYLIPLLGGLVYGWFAYIKTKQGGFWDRTRIKLPIFGAIAHKICLARFTRTLASLIRSGVPILEVLNIVANTCGNVIMEKAIRTASSDIERGDSISNSLGKHPIFPTMIIRMITAGEQTGKIDSMLERVADFLDEEIETTLSGLTSLIEPLLIVFLGVVIGGIVICMFLPIFKMSEIINPPGK
jgi:type IV pilus assembly protein PilC